METFQSIMVMLDQGVDAISNVKDEVSLDDFVFMSQVDSDLSNFSQACWDGYLIAKEKARAQGNQLVLFENIQEVPIVKKDHEPRILLRKDKPVPVRANTPLFEDVCFASLLFERDAIIADIQRAEQVAQSLGKQFCHLTVNDYPCDYYYESFMMDRSSPNITAGDNLFYTAMDKFKVPENIDRAYSIWAEDSKAMGRYCRTGIKHLTVLFPRGYPDQNYVKYRKFVLEKYPGFVLDRMDIDPEDVLIDMTSQEFIDTYDLDERAFFFSVYLPQFLHLRSQFAGYMCIFSDEEVVANSETGAVDYFSSDLTAVLDYYTLWFHKNRKDIVNSGHGGIFDPVRRVRISFSQHGCFLDHIRNSTDFCLDDGDVQLLSTFAGVTSSSRLKIACSYNVVDEGCDVVMDDEEHLLITYEDCNVCDISWVESLPECLFMPLIELEETSTDKYGKFVDRDVVIDVGKPDRDLLIGYVKDVLYIFDIRYARKDFFARRDLIPKIFRYPYSSSQDWENSFVIFPRSFAPVNSFRVSLQQRLKFLDAFSGTQEVTEQFKEVTIPGIAWNPNMKAVVFDENSYFYAGPFSFGYIPTGRTRYYEFSTQYAVRQELTFEIDHLKFELPASKLEERVPPDLFQCLISAAFSPRVVTSLMLQFLPSFSNFSRKTLCDEAQIFELNADHSVVSDLLFDLEPVSVASYLRYPRDSYMALINGHLVELDNSVKISCSIANVFNLKFYDVMVDGLAEMTVDYLYVW